jgi:hypothetical protein
MDGEARLVLPVEERALPRRRTQGVRTGVQKGQPDNRKLVDAGRQGTHRMPGGVHVNVVSRSPEPACGPAARVRGL